MGKLDKAKMTRRQEVKEGAKQQGQKQELMSNLREKDLRQLSQHDRQQLKDIEILKRPLMGAFGRKGNLFRCRFRGQIIEAWDENKQFENDPIYRLSINGQEVHDSDKAKHAYEKLLFSDRVLQREQSPKIRLSVNVPRYGRSSYDKEADMIIKKSPALSEAQMKEGTDVVIRKKQDAEKPYYERDIETRVQEDKTRRNVLGDFLGE